MSARNLKAVRAAAWKTRRKRYGAKGHNSAYSRSPSSCAACAACARMQAYLAWLYADGFLSEGQVARVTGLDRVSLRKLADEQAARQTARSPAPPFAGWGR